MRVAIISDLHMDQWRKNSLYSVDADIHAMCQKIEDSNAEAIMLAGDVAGWRYSYLIQDLISKLVQVAPVYFVPGNHEFWGSYLFSNVIEYIEKLETRYKDFHYVHAGNQNILHFDNDTAIIGDTLWTDIDKGNPLRMVQFNRGWSDFQMCETLFAENAVEWHQQAKDNIIQSLECIKDSQYKNVIVMTHHLPSEQSLDPKYKGSETDFMFYSDLTDIIEEYEPSLWIHGHTHIKREYYIGKTRVACNPRGYSFERQDFADYEPMIINL